MIRSPSPDTPRVLVVGGDGLAARVRSLLSQCGVVVDEAGTAPGDPRDVSGHAVVALVSERPWPAVEDELDTACWRARLPWTSASMVAHRFRIGPTVVPGRTPCHECWRRRVRSRVSDVRVHDAIAEFADDCGRERWFSGSLSPLDHQVAAILAGEVMALVSGEYQCCGTNLGRYWQGDCITGCLESHRFASIGTCRRCVPDSRRHPAGTLSEFVAEEFGPAESTTGRDAR